MMGKATLIGFLAIPVLLILLISSMALGLQVQAELAAQVLASVLVAMVATALTCGGARNPHC
jgi:hypothetical protein